MSDMFTVDVTTEGDTVVFTLVGEFDLSGRPTFDDAVGALDPSVPELIVDLSGLTFIDSTGLGCFARAHNELAARRTRLVLRNPSPSARRTLDVVDLGKSIDIID